MAVPRDPGLKKLIDGAANLGVELAEGPATELLAFLDLLLAKNRKFNLTGIKNRDEGIEKHLLDALSVVPVIDSIPPVSDTITFDGKQPPRASAQSSQGALLDVGSGGGVPGLPLKLARPQIRVSLVEAKAKKVRFLKETVQKLGLKHTKVYQHFLDPECPVDFLGRYDWIVTRATTTIEAFLRNAILYKKENGAIIVMKGPNVDQEIEESVNQIQRLGLKIDRVHRLELPFSKAGRTLLILR